MKFFLPYWEDWVHRDFDPLTDTYSGGYENAVFAHEIFSPPPYDGILVSLGMFELKLKLIKENGRPKIRGFSNIKDYLRVNGKLPVLGDCGAFTYVNEKRPPLSNEKALLEAILPLIKEHLTPSQLYKQKSKDPAIRRLSTRVNIQDLVLVAKADHFGRTTNDAKNKKYLAGEWLLKKAKKLKV
ncbi:MAG: hypothetical protein DSY35_00105, partial [Desulfurobacterium sp.]